MSEFFEYDRNNEALRLIKQMENECPENWDDAAIRAELRRLHEAHDWQYRMAADRLRRIEKLEAERDAYKADAERYRWLRDRAWPFEFKGNSPEDADAAIDVARGET